MVAMVISSMVGTLIPIVFPQDQNDPAVASGPLITTVNDLVAVIHLLWTRMAASDPCAAYDLIYRQRQLVSETTLSIYSYLFNCDQSPITYITLNRISRTSNGLEVFVQTILHLPDDSHNQSYEAADSFR